MADDYEAQYAALAQYKAAAASMCQEIIDLARRNGPDAAQRAGVIVTSAYEAHDLTLWTCIVGWLATRIVQAEHRAHEAHGPLVQVDDDGGSEGWQTAVHDQMAAAAEERDAQAFASISLEGLVRAFREDEDDSFDNVLGVLMRLDHMTLAVTAAEAVRRQV